jgi:TonB family protein
MKSGYHLNRFSIFKNSFLILISLINHFPSFSQKTDTLYYTAAGRITLKEKATYYRIGNFDNNDLKFIGDFTDFYNNDTVFITGSYTKDGKKNGPYKCCYSSGLVYCEGQFLFNEFTGPWNFYYSDGRLNMSIYFRKGDFIITEFTDSTGTRSLHEGTGKWYKKYIDDMGRECILTGEYKNGRKSGTWKYNLLNTQSGYEEKYDNGNLTSAVKIVEKTEIPCDSSVFTIGLFNLSYLNAVEQFNLDMYPPIYGEGPFAFGELLRDKLKYPNTARKANINGLVSVSFLINTDGTSEDFNVVKGLGYGCDEEAIRVLKMMGLWIPPVFAGKSIKLRWVLTVPFPYRETNPMDYSIAFPILFKNTDQNFYLGSFPVDPENPIYKFKIDHF